MSFIPVCAMGRRQYLVEAIVPCLLMTAAAACGAYFFYYKTLLLCLVLFPMVLGFCKVDLAFYLLVVLTPFDLLVSYFLSKLEWAQSAMWKEAFTIVVLLALVPRAFLTRRLKVAPLDAAVLAFVGYVFLRTIVMGWEAAAFSGFKITVQMLVFYLIGLVALYNPRRRRWFLNLILASGAITVAMAWVDRLAPGVSINRLVSAQSTIESTLRSGIHREHGLLTSAYNMGFFLALILWISLVTALNRVERRMVRGAGLAVAAAGLMPFLLTYSRSAWVALLGTLVIGGLLAGRKLVAFLPAALAPLFLWVSPAVSERFVSIFEHDPRTWIWKAHLTRLFPEYPLFGIGPGYFSADASGKVVDNLLLTIMLETGVVGLALIVFVLYRAYGAIVAGMAHEDAERRYFAEAAMGVFFICLIIGLFGGGWRNFPGGFYFWLFLGGISRLGAGDQEA